ncbi:MAG: glycosyltransferase family 4 protein [Bacteroidota bacterium]|nr:glycosyltransferase family 4 protein [Bacteroidota bacterium]
MKLLHIMPYSPVPPTFGGALRIYNLLRQMTKNHEVTLITFGNSNTEFELRSHFDTNLKNIHVLNYPYLKPFKRFNQLFSLFNKSSFAFRRTYHQETQRLIDGIVTSDNFDIVQTEFPHMASYKINSDAIKIMDAHNVEYSILKYQWQHTSSPLRKIFYHKEFQKIFHEEITVCRRQDALLVTSADDKNTLDKDVPDVPKYIVPNGVDTNYFIPSTEKPKPHTLVFSGAMSYIPNYDGILYFLDNIFPLITKSIPDTKLYIVGNMPPKNLLKRASENIIITGYTDDVRPYIWRSSVYIVPLRMGSGTRLKVLEALSMKKPIVTTTIGCEGIDVENGRTAIITDEPQAFAEAVIRILKDPYQSKNLIDNGFELVKKRYDWSVIGEKLDNVYNLLIKK